MGPKVDPSDDRAAVEPVTAVPSAVRAATTSVCRPVSRRCFTVPVAPAIRPPPGVRVSSRLRLSYCAAAVPGGVRLTGQVTRSVCGMRRYDA